MSAALWSAEASGAMPDIGLELPWFMPCDGVVPVPVPVPAAHPASDRAAARAAAARLSFLVVMGNLPSGCVRRRAPEVLACRAIGAADGLMRHIRQAYRRTVSRR